MTKEAKGPSIKTIADNLGLATNTVSRALRGLHYVSPKTMERVQAEAAKLGYVPNSAARALVLGSANSLGLVITNPSNPFYSELISAVERRSRQQDFTLHMMVSEENLENEERAVDIMLRWRVDGAIVVPTQVATDPWQRFVRGGGHLLCVNRPLVDVDSDFIGVDYEQGAFEAANHLIVNGFGPILVFEEDLAVSTVESRIAGVRRAVQESDGQFDDASILRIESPREHDSTLPWVPQSAYEAALEVLPHLSKGTGIVTGTDFLALGIYRAAAETGRQIGKDIGVVGQGDHPFAAFLTPGLTTLKPPARDIGFAAVDRMAAKTRRGQHSDDNSDSSELPPQQDIHLPILQERGSTVRVLG